MGNPLLFQLSTADDLVDRVFVDNTGISTILDSYFDLFKSILWTQWLALLGCIFVGVVVSKLAHVIFRKLGDLLLERKHELRGKLFHFASGPLSLVLVASGIGIGLLNILPHDSNQLRMLLRGVYLLYLLSMGWFFYNLVDLVDLFLRRITSKTATKLDDLFVPLVRKALRIFVIVVFAIFIAQNVFNANVSAWLAGLGIAGLAVSLAAQDSIKNFFGSMTVLFDRPFTVGDRIQFLGFDGTVEEIGFRSTRLRTATGDRVTIPNSRMVDNIVQNMARPRHTQRTLELGIPQDTPVDKIHGLIASLKDILHDPQYAESLDLHAKPPAVTLDAIKPNVVVIKIVYWQKNSDPNLTSNAEQVNYRLLELFKDADVKVVG